MVPPAPGRFSTTIGRLSITTIRRATARDVVSLMRPAAKGSQVMGRLDQI
jgi:hypothetical protein